MVVVVVVNVVVKVVHQEIAVEILLMAVTEMPHHPGQSDRSY